MYIMGVSVILPKPLLDGMRRLSLSFSINIYITIRPDHSQVLILSCSCVLIFVLLSMSPFLLISPGLSLEHLSPPFPGPFLLLQVQVRPLQEEGEEGEEGEKAEGSVLEGRRRSLFRRWQQRPGPNRTSGDLWCQGRKGKRRGVFRGRLQSPRVSEFRATQLHAERPDTSSWVAWRKR